jgi:preprotein translocase subunit SecE
MSLSDYLKETRAELKHVSWPTRRQAIMYTIVVIVISLGLSLYLGLFDYLFSTGLKYLIGRF